MVRVMAQGVFDLLHLGHVHYLEKAKELGDELVVVIASDKTVRERKHEPVTPQEMRKEMVEALRCVDQVVIGSEGDRYETVERLRPDIIALGYDPTPEGAVCQHSLLLDRVVGPRLGRILRVEACR